MVSDVIVIGAGISGLSAGQMLLEHNIQSTVVERGAKPGGLIKCDRVEGVLFHRVGGHVFNSKNPDVSAWFWKHFDVDTEFLRAERNAKILLRDQLIGYPIENYIYMLGDDLVRKIIPELIERSNDEIDLGSNSNFEKFLIGTFGPTLYAEYFGPYNEKIWRADLSKVPLDWLEGKLPMPKVKDIILNNLLRRREEGMVHSTFFYPRVGGSQFLVDRLSKNLSIRSSCEVRSLRHDGRNWVVNEEIVGKGVVFTGDIRTLASLVSGVPAKVSECLTPLQSLQSNGTSNLLCETDPTDLSWLYLPDPDLRAHRVIYTGNFSATNNSGNGRTTCTVEFSGKVSVDEMRVEAKRIPGIGRVLDWNYEPNSYVIQTTNTRAQIDLARSELESLGLFLSGRFAEWEYHNMDKAIESAARNVQKMVAWLK